MQYSPSDNLDSKSRECQPEPSHWGHGVVAASIAQLQRKAEYGPEEGEARGPSLSASKTGR